MKFPYLKTPHRDPNKKWISRPIIPVTLYGPKGSVNVHALLDSGADKCLFSRELGEEIGLDIKNGEAELFSGIEGGKVETYLHEIQLQFIGSNDKVDVIAGFTDACGAIAILGQDYFFDAFRIKFERDCDAIEINPSKKFKNLTSK